MGKRYNQGKWFPKNPGKYAGNPNDIVYRSSWELRFFNWADQNSSVVSWASEEIIVPYICETDNRWHRYFVDVAMKIADSNGNIRTYLVEIKPHAQTLPPKYTGKQTARYITESQTFVKNQSKWKAAKEYARKRGAEFVVITEKELGIK
jgi:hypothetical protein